MKSSKYWIMGTAIMFAAFTACSSTHTRSDESAVVATPTADSSSPTAVNTGKNTMEKGAAPEFVNPADDTVERRNANHYQSKWNRSVAAAPVAADKTVQTTPAPEAISTTKSSADLGASSSGMGR